MTRDAATIVRESGLPNSDTLAESLRPSIRVLTSQIGSDDLPLGASRLGGVPDLPPGFHWPSWEAPERTWDRVAQASRVLGHQRRPLAFVAQFDLAEIKRLVPECGWPGNGWLAFFYDHEHQPGGSDSHDRGGARVIWIQADHDALVRWPIDENTPFPPCAVDLGVEMLPDPAVFEELSDEDDWRVLESLLSKLSLAPDRPEHRLQGYAQPIQSAVNLECALLFDEERGGGSQVGGDAPPLPELAAQWQLLLQLDTDEEGLGWMWGDCGRIYFMCREADVHAGRFDEAWTIMQCH